MAEKTIREALHYAKENISSPKDVVQLSMASMMLDTIEKNIDSGKKLDDTIDFNL
jgi:hypothetical protein